MDKITQITIFNFDIWFTGNLGKILLAKQLFKVTSVVTIICPNIPEKMKDAAILVWFTKPKVPTKKKCDLFEMFKWLSDL